LCMRLFDLVSTCNTDECLLCRPPQSVFVYRTMSVSREDLLAAAEDDSSERFIGLIAKHVSAALESICVALSKLEYAPTLSHSFFYRFVLYGLPTRKLSGIEKISVKL